MRVLGLFSFVITILLYVGCQNSHPTTASGPAGGRQKSQPTTLSGLESLSRVRLVVKGPDTQPALLSGHQPDEKIDDLEALAKQRLHEQLPQLNTDGGADDWILESQLAWQGEILPHGAAKVPDYWLVCRIRLFKSVVVDGRRAEAVAYEGLMHVGDLGYVSGIRKNALERAISRFAAEWAGANPGMANR